MFKLLTRCILIVMLLGVCLSRLDETLRRLLLWEVGRKTSMNAEIETLHVDFPGKKAAVKGLRLTDPKQGGQQGGREILHADSVALSVANNDLLHRRRRIREGVVHGLRIHVNPLAGKQEGMFVPDEFWLKLKQSLPESLSTGDGKIGDAASVSLGLLFGGVDFNETATRLLARFETVGMMQNLQERWPEEAARFKSRAGTIETHLKQLQLLLNSVDQAGDKSVQVRLILQQLAKIDEEIRSVDVELQKVRQQGQADMKALAAARQNDTKRLDDLTIPKIDPKEISERIVGEALRNEYQRLLVWGDWARSLVEPSVLPERESWQERLGIDVPARNRGTVVRFPGMEEGPEWALDVLHVDGELLFGETPVYFLGQVCDFAHPLEAGTMPMVAQFCFSGRAMPVSPILTDEIAQTLRTPEARQELRPGILPDIFVELGMDRTRTESFPRESMDDPGEAGDAGSAESVGPEEPTQKAEEKRVKIRDRLVVRCPIYRFPEQVFGNPEELAVAVSLGYATLDAVLEFLGEDANDPENVRIDGQVRIVQHNIALRPIVPPSLQGAAHESSPGSTAARILTETLAGIQTLTTEIRITGPRDQPVYTVQSNLGTQLAASLETALARQMGQARQQLERTLNEDVGKAASTINAVTEEMAPALIKELTRQQADFDKQVAGNAVIGALLQSQMSQLSEKDKDRINQVLQTPILQGLLNAPAPPANTEGNPETSLPREIEKAIPGLLDRLRPPQ
ncbi:MAG TPA: hypothetical protein DEB39_11955 [Planctomycetaceae bacterium]|nr:hypothetical protein [Planctomycetaceae bacterium]